MHLQFRYYPVKDIDKRFIIPALIAAGGAVAAASMSGGGGGDPYVQLPDYPEATQARQSWSQKMTEWGQDPSYGAVPQDWGAIWEKAKGKVKDYYGGTATSQGLYGKVKASAARRGVSESPAMEAMLGRVGVEEAGQMRDIATEQAIAEGQFGESGRLNYMNMLQGLSSQKPSFVTNSGMISQPSGMGDVVGSATAGISEYMMGQEQNKWYENMLSKYSQFGDTQTSSSGGGNADYSAGNLGKASVWNTDFNSQNQSMTIDQLMNWGK